MKQSHRKLLLAAAVAAGLSQPSAALAAPGQVYVNLFEWKWNDIAQECTQFLKPAGFSAVQISVPTEAKSNNRQWWERYQPASYKLDSRSGSREQLAAMVSTCRNAGIAIYADVVMNHMANGSGTGTAGSFYNNATSYPLAGYDAADFHARCAVNDSSTAQVQNCWLGGDLPDLKTGSSKVRGVLGNYLKDLLSLGIAGFRVDASKHMPATDLQEILRLAGPVRQDVISTLGIERPWLTHEVFGGFGPISETERSTYFSLGTANEFKYKDVLRDAFTRANGLTLAQLYATIPVNDSRPNPRGMFASRNATVFVSNHDTERHDQSLNAGYGKRFNLANIFMLAYPYGQPQLQSGFKLSYPTDAQGRIPNDQPVPANAIYDAAGTADFTAWDQQHRWREIGNMVEFRNQTQGKWQVDDWTSNGADRIAFHRGDRGFVAINRDDSNFWVGVFRTGMAPGRYCNVINGALTADGSSCSGDIITVNADSTASLSIPGMNGAGMPAVAIHAGQKIASVVIDNTPPSIPPGLVGQIVGNTVVLSWQPSTDPESGIKGYHVFRNNVEIGFVSGTRFTDSAPLPGSTNNYWVVAENGAATKSAACVVLSVSIPLVIDTTPPSVPLNFVATQIGSNSVSLSWGASIDNESGVTRYHILRNGVEVGVSTTTSFTDGGLLPATGYQYTVVAENAVGLKSPPCQVLPVLTLALDPDCLVQVDFQVSDNTTVYGQDLYLTGSRNELGNWNTATAARLSGLKWPLWTISRQLRAGTTYEYKYIKKGVKALQWETGSNRTLTVPACNSPTLTVALSNFRQ